MAFFNKDIEELKSLFDGKYKQIITILSHPEYKEGLTKSQIAKKIKDKGYQYTHRCIDILHKRGFVELIPTKGKGNPCLVKLVSGDNAEKIANDLIKITTKDIIEQVSKVYPKSKFKKVD